MVQTILIWIAVGSGASGLIISILSYRPDARLKKTQSDLNEQNLLRGIIDELKSEIDGHGRRIATLEGIISEMKQEKTSLLLKIEIFIESFKCRILCNRRSCPIEDKFKELGGEI